MSQSTSSDLNALDNIPAIDDDEQSNFFLNILIFPKNISSKWKNQFSNYSFFLLSPLSPNAVVVEDEHTNNNNIGNVGSKSMDSINSYDGSREMDDDLNDQGDDNVEKARLISQVLELQNTLDDLNQRVDGVKEENLRLKSENMVLGQYIENLMSASSVFSSTSPSNIKKK